MLSGPDLTAIVERSQPDLRSELRAIAAHEKEVRDLLPWVGQLSDRERRLFLSDLGHLLSEAETCGEELDLQELYDLFQEFAAAAAWDGPLLLPGGEPADEPAPFRLDIRDEDRRELERAPTQVRKNLEELLGAFLPFHPDAFQQLPCGRPKKMPNRGLWQIELPEGYRLRYIIDKSERIVYVVYLGPHPEGHAGGREAMIRAAIQRRRHGGHSSG